ncbi:M14 family metallopeptidase [Motilibacter aurantiacus]|uniref:M14 family metallopeptidase n=1 Tax=Motilibacter aurantiacus TaxID=2714955 RepID=UPI00140CA0BE|nr:DUF2817 domain-containing protein [Motilibacter aurantiacus]
MRPRALAVSALATTLAASVSTGVAYGVRSADTPAPSFSVPSLAAQYPTPFEANGATNWTSLAEEQSFLSALDAASPRTSISQVGTTKQGRPIQLVEIKGTPKNSSMKDHATVLFTCLQHGNEPAAREGCLVKLRDLALADDPAVVKMLQDVTVLFVPTVNPDGRAANTRANSDGIDINRDHLELESLEAQTIAKLFRERKPDLVHDTHEYSSAPRTDITYMWPRNRNVHEAVHDLAHELNVEWVAPSVEAGGFTTNQYGITVKNGKQVAQSAGDGDERILRNATGLHHALGILVESYTANQNAAEQADPTLNRKRRVETQARAIDGTLAMVAKNRTRRDITAATDLSRASATTRWASNIDAFAFAGADNELPATNEIALTPPCAYTLTGAQLAEVGGLLERHGVAVTPLENGGARVSMAQESASVIPLLLDTRALYSPVNATATTTCTTP